MQYGEGDISVYQNTSNDENGDRNGYALRVDCLPNVVILIFNLFFFWRRGVDGGGGESGDKFDVDVESDLPDDGE